MAPPLPASLLSVLGLLALGLTSCMSAAVRAGADLQKLPPYEGHGAELFDDSIESAALGLAFDRPSFRGNATFRERTKLADLVADVKITTVSVGKTDEKASYQLDLALTGQPLHGAADGVELTVAIKQGNPSYSLLQQIDTRARGHSMIGMARRFRSGDDVQYHWYFAPDDAESVAAVKEALALEEFSKL